MKKQTIISLIITIVLFIASIVLIALAINTVTTPITYNFGHGFFRYHVSYISSYTTHNASIMFSLGKVLLIAAFIMLGFTLYFSTKKEEVDYKKGQKSEKREYKKDYEDATIKEEIKKEEEDSNT